MSRSSRRKAGRIAGDKLKDKPVRSMTGPEARRLYLEQIANDPDEKARYWDWVNNGQWDERIW